MDPIDTNDANVQILETVFFIHILTRLPQLISQSSEILLSGTSW